MNEKVEVRPPGRWDVPFDPDMGEGDVARVRRIPIFRDIDPEAFPPNLPLTEIIKNDARILRCRPGEVVVREGDYGNSLLVVLSGTVRLLTDPSLRQKGPRRGRGPKGLRRVLGAIRQLFCNSRIPERRAVSDQFDDSELGLAEDNTQRTKSQLANYRQLIEEQDLVQLSAPQMFGETEALSRTPHTATVFADSVAELLELRWQGLREIRRWDKGFRTRLDQLYRSRSLKEHLREAPYFRDLDETALTTIAGQTLLESHGENEWSAEYKRVLSHEPEDIIRSEPVIAETGDYLDGLVVIRSGFGRITELAGQGRRTVGFVTKNELFGLEEIIEHWRSGVRLQYRHGLHAVGYVDLLRIPTALVEQFLLPALFPESRQQSGNGWRSATAPEKTSQPAPQLEEATLNFLVNNRTINGTAVMFINTDRCTGCDDCVRACAVAHDSNPRFLRHGPEQDHLMVANACMHCVDPVCLVGCPTGAIHRRADDGLVVIDDATCIGCAVCANTCPYDNIRMVETRDRRGNFIIDAQTRKPILKATKCDFCSDQPGGPACQRACPHDALIRLDARDRRFLADWMKR